MLRKEINQNPFPGEGMSQGPIIPWYPSQFTTNPKSAGQSPALELDEQWPQIGVGNKFAFGHLDISGQTASIISAGACLTIAAPGTDTVSASLTDAVTGQIYGITLVTGNLTPNAEVGNYLYMVNLGVMKKIKANTATNVIFSLKDTTNGPNAYDSDAINAGPAGSSAVSIIRPGHVVVNATPGIFVGWLVNDALEGSDIVYQTKGLGLLIGNNSGDALVAGTPGVVVAGGIIAGGTPTTVLMGDGFIIPLESYDGANTLIPCYAKGCGA